MTVKEIVEQLEKIKVALEENGSNHFKLDVAYDYVDTTIQYLKMKGDIKNQKLRWPFVEK